ncbi:MAG: cbb3-type cytochrome oxidase assembly protein CcoS [Deltaproteobacteria bacterium]|nr:cbb3-type cytochrome oxidase assembly protein CcoS [Deltaproteobacteria bacterium]
MSVVYIVLPLALVFAGIFVGAFIWAVRRGQLDDLETPAIRVAFEDLPSDHRRRDERGDAGSPPEEEHRST